jgi:hypothetical protein
MAVTTGQVHEMTWSDTTLWLAVALGVVTLLVGFPEHAARRSARA